MIPLGSSNIGWIIYRVLCIEHNIMYDTHTHTHTHTAREKKTASIHNARIKEAPSRSPADLHHCGDPPPFHRKTPHLMPRRSACGRDITRRRGAVRRRRGARSETRPSLPWGL